MQALKFLGCCSMKHTLFYFSCYRAPKYCGCISVRLYSKHFRNLDQVVFLLEPQSWMGKAGWFCFPSLQLFPAARKYVCYLNVCCHRLQGHAVTVGSFTPMPVRGMSKWRIVCQVVWWRSRVCKLYFDLHYRVGVTFTWGLVLKLFWPLMLYLRS